MMTCPLCEGTGKSLERSPVPLTNMQFRIFKIVRGSPHGIEGRRLIDRVYADQRDGGPDFASRSVHVQICKMNGRLKAVGLQIKATARGRGGVYRLGRV